MEKKRYEAPEARDLSGMRASGQDPLACSTGFDPTGGPGGDVCNVGFSALAGCTAGAAAIADCAVGQGAVGGAPCAPGGAPGNVCAVGTGLGEPLCSAGSAN